VTHQGELKKKGELPDGGGKIPPASGGEGGGVFLIGGLREKEKDRVFDEKRRGEK